MIGKILSSSFNPLRSPRLMSGSVMIPENFPSLSLTMSNLNPLWEPKICIALAIVVFVEIVIFWIP